MSPGLLGGAGEAPGLALALRDEAVPRDQRRYRELLDPQQLGHLFEREFLLS